MFEVNQKLMFNNNFSDSLEYQLALSILNDFIKKKKSKKLTYAYIEKQVRKIGKKLGYNSISSLTSFAVADIIENGSLYTVFEN